MLSLAAVLLATQVLQPPPSPQSNGEPPVMRSGRWTGGTGVLGGDRPHWDSFGAEITVDGETVTGTMHESGGERVLKGKQKDGEVTFSAGRGRFTGRLVEDGAYLLGEREVRGEAEPFQLYLEPIPSIEELEPLVGVYAVDDEHRIAMAMNGRHLLMNDYGRGILRILYATGEDAFLTGRSVSVPHPSERTIVFERDDPDDERRVTGFTMKEPDGTSLHARATAPLRYERFEYAADDGVMIRGTLTLPSGAGPHPAAVWVHGSGAQERGGVGTWALFLGDLGIACLAVDKRGVGESEGTYELPDGGHDNQPHMRRRAGDVHAAVRALGAHDDVDPERIGLIGASQAGWVIPMAAEHGGVAFAVTISGGATPLSVENEFSRLAKEGESDAENISIEDAYVEIRRHRPRDYAFDEHFAALPCPGLWLYGDLDRSNPSRLCAELLERIRDEHGKDFTIELFPTGDHSLRDARLGGAAEARTLGRSVPGLHAKIADWLERKGFVSE
ncbi:MAG: prolyl oligopeptidase family serine peptidase [Planctomycetota bacterium]|nr:prolyl oligopeptidase family serine peptidase [Planctomycetota bacterium]